MVSHFIFNQKWRWFWQCAPSYVEVVSQFFVNQTLCSHFVTWMHLLVSNIDGHYWFCCEGAPFLIVVVLISWPCLIVSGIDGRDYRLDWCCLNCYLSALSLCCGFFIVPYVIWVLFWSFRAIYVWCRDVYSHLLSEFVWW